MADNTESGYSTTTVATAAVLGFVVGAAAGVGVTLGVSSGEEAPIRVKNGSFELELYGGQQWEQDGDRRNWKIQGNRQRRGNDYHLTIAHSNASDCSASEAPAQRITFTFSDGTSIEVRATGRRTRITSGNDMTGTGGRLSYGPPGGFINAITLDANTTPLCTFAQKDPQLWVWMIDP
jgi:hypothetical protein